MSKHRQEASKRQQFALWSPVISAFSAWQCSWLLGELPLCFCSPGGTADERVSKRPPWLDLNCSFFRCTLLVTEILSVLRSEHWYFFPSSVFLCVSAVYLPWVCCMSSLSKCCIVPFLLLKLCLGIRFASWNLVVQKWFFWGKLLRGIWLPSMKSTIIITAFVCHRIHHSWVIVTIQRSHWRQKNLMLVFTISSLSKQMFHTMKCLLSVLPSSVFQFSIN